MKLFEQLKSNASRMAVYAILVATALCGIAAPVYALNGEKGDVEPAYMASTVKDRYKAFSGDTFYVAEYDTTYRHLLKLGLKTVDLVDDLVVALKVLIGSKGQQL